MNCKYGIYINVKSKSGQLLRAGTIYQPTLGLMQQAAYSALWLIGVESAKVVSIKEIKNWHKSKQKLYRSDKYYAETLNPEVVVEYYYRKVTGK